MIKLRKLLKILNPFIWGWNQFKYNAHLNFYSEISNSRKKRGLKSEYEYYDFEKNDTKYF